MKNAEASAPLTKRRPSRWHRPFWYANLIAVVALLLAYLGAHVSPATFWPLAFIGMAYPFIMAAHLFFIGWWLVFRRKRIWPSLIAILLGWGNVGAHFQLFGEHDKPEEVTTPVKVMSYNVRLFDLYNWTHSSNTRDEILDLIRAEDPDIMCLQEFVYQKSRHSFLTRDTLMHGFRFSYRADAYTAHTRSGHHFGIATFSTHPIIAHGTIDFPDDLNNLCLWCDVLIGHDTIRVYNGHLASIRFGDVDYRFMQDIGHGEGTDSLPTAGQRILDRLKNAFIRRATETEKIARHMRKSPHPILWCGDLNDTPMSYSYNLLRDQDLSDAFVESGQGIGHTYIGAFPAFRIDHMLHGPALRAWDFRTLPDEFSDHHPITCWMGLAH